MSTIIHGDSHLGLYLNKLDTHKKSILMFLLLDLDLIDHHEFEQIF